MAKFPVKEIYPIWYFSSYKDNDGNWVRKQMLHIPLEHKRNIADRYEIIYQKPTTTGNRKRANTFLNKMAKYFFNKKQQRKQFKKIF